MNLSRRTSNNYRNKITVIRVDREKANSVFHDRVRFSLLRKGPGGMRMSQKGFRQCNRQVLSSNLVLVTQHEINEKNVCRDHIFCCLIE